MNIKTMIKKHVPLQVVDFGKKIYRLPKDMVMEKDFKQYCKESNLENLKANLETNVLAYTNSLNVEGAKYRFSEDAMEPTLYASVFACLIKGFYGEISETEKKEWLEYFNQCQRAEDGLFMDDVVTDDLYLHSRQGYGARHLVGHLTIAYDRLGGVPKHELSYLDEYKNPDDVIKWLSNLNYRKIWGSSNEIMNIGVAMQFARDRMGLPYDSAIEAMEEYLVKNIRKEYGLWYEGKIDSKTGMYEAIRGAYHIIPVLKYDNIDIPYAKQCLELLYDSQNKWGGFDNLIGSSACADIDAIDPLLRLSLQESIDLAKIDEMLYKAERWIYFNQNQDGGFAFGRKSPFVWGNSPHLSSALQHSNLFATWFRTLSLQLIENYRDKNNKHRIWTPGMECPMFLEE